VQLLQRNRREYLLRAMANPNSSDLIEKSVAAERQEDVIATASGMVHVLQALQHY